MSNQVQIGETYETVIQRGPTGEVLCHVTILDTKTNNDVLKINVNIKELTGKKRTFNNIWIPLRWITTNKSVNKSGSPNHTGGRERINLKGGSKRVIRYGSRGGRYYMKGGNKHYI